jgi:hypothetical protein
MTMDSQDNRREPNLWDVTRSVFAAFLGVQSRKNYERDFKHGKPWQYIVVGLIGVAIFIFLVIAAVKFALSSAGV